MFYARLKPHNPKQGFILHRYHFLGNLYQGGDRPTWYRVDDELANRLTEDFQETGRPSFDVVTAEEKLAIDKIEEERRLVAMGMMSATLNVPLRANPLNVLTTPQASAREAAIPAAKTDGGDLRSADFRHPLTPSVEE